MPDLDLTCVFCLNTIKKDESIWACKSPRCCKMMHSNCAKSFPVTFDNISCPSCGWCQTNSVDPDNCCKMFILMSLLAIIGVLAASNLGSFERFQALNVKMDKLTMALEECDNDRIGLLNHNVIIPDVSHVVCHVVEQGPLPEFFGALIDRSNQLFYSSSFIVYKRSYHRAWTPHFSYDLESSASDAKNKEFLQTADDICRIIEAVSQSITRTKEHIKVSFN